jgi:hypothetical protein
MTIWEQIDLFGLIPDDENLETIRATLRKEIELERNSGQREDDLALLCCVQLFSRGLLEDVILIWEAKSSGFDLGSYLDVQLLCGAGLQQTKVYLSSLDSNEAAAALSYIKECEESGDFRDWSPSKQMAVYHTYFSRN